MKRRLTQKEQEQEEIVKTKIAVWYILLGGIMFAIVLAQNVNADEIKFQSKSPSFSGIGQSAHYLTVESQEYTRKEQLRADLKALEDQRKSCLLYTSPSPRDGLLSRMPSSA